MSSNKDSIDGKYKVSSANNLWEPLEINVFKGTIIESSVRQGIEIGSDFNSMKKYWEKFDGENKYLIEKLKDEK